MGLFRRKKKNAVIVTLAQNLGKELDKHDKKIDIYLRTKPQLLKLIKKYKTSLTTHAHIYDGIITIHLQEEFNEKYPDGFFAYADKLGLNVEPICGTYNDSLEKAITVRAKSK